MTLLAEEQLAERRCKACQGGDVKKCSAAEAEEQLRALSGWELTADADRIQKKWQVVDFMAGIDFFNKVAEVAQAEDHHPDLHLESYRNVRIELSTHAVGGLSENDFILAAKIDRLPIRRRT